jgi:tRNA(guanine-26,N2-N2) methyltransferase
MRAAASGRHLLLLSGRRTFAAAPVAPTAMASRAGPSKAAALGGLVPQPLEALPAVPPGALTITEGAAVVLYAGKDAVFYNRVQILNRDLSVTIVRCYDRARRAAATPRDVRKAWNRRQITEALLAHGAKHAAAAADAAAAGAAGAAAAPPSLFPAPPFPTMVRHTPEGNDLAARFGITMMTDATLPAALPGLRVLEALSASGLRSVRYAKEVPGLAHVVVNDLDPAAVASILANVAFNGVPPGRLQPAHADATLLMYLCREPHLAFDVIDLDPYGTAVPFLDGAVQAVLDGGLLAVTCTDMQVLASQQQPDVCHSKYGGQPLKARYCHEQALRLVLGAVESAANRYGRTIRPLVSVSVDFYVRVFVTVHACAEEANRSSVRKAHLYQCTGCDAYWVQPIGALGREEAAGGGGGSGGGGGGGGGAATGGHERGVEAVGAAQPGASTSQPGGEGDGEERMGGGADAGGDDASAAAAGGRGPKRLRLDNDADAGAGAGAGAAARGGRAGKRRGLGGTAQTGDGGGGHRKKAHASFVPHTPGALCPHCTRPVQIGGPIWSGPLHDRAFAASVLDEAVRVFGADGRGIAGATAVPDRFYDVHPPPTEGGVDGSAAPPAAGAAAAGAAAAGATAAAAAASASEPAPRAPAAAAARVAPRAPHDAGSNDIDTVASSRRRLQGLLRCIVNELPDAPLYYDLPSLCARLNVTPPPLAEVWAGLVHAGYRVSGSHCGSDALKTDAPPGVVWGLFAQHEASLGADVRARHREARGTVTHALLASAGPYAAAHPFDTTVTPDVAAELARQRGDGPRYVANPGASWGPGTRASADLAKARAERRGAAEAAAGAAGGEAAGAGAAGGEAAAVADAGVRQ